MKIYVLLGQQVDQSYDEFYLSCIGAAAYSSLEKAKAAAQLNVAQDWDEEDEEGSCPDIEWLDSVDGGANTAETLFNGEDLEIRCVEIDPSAAR